MIDETLLADPERCPSCSAALEGRPSACPACHLRLEGPVAARLWQVSTEAARLLGERSHLLVRLRSETDTPPYAAAAPGYAAAAPAAPPAPPAPPAPRPEWTPRRVQNLLLSLGVGLLGVAAVIFLAVSWGSLGVGGRAAVMTGVTALAAVAAHRTARRGLTATAEALSLLTVGLALLDFFGARASDLAGLQAVDPLPFAAATAATVALAAGAGSLVLRTRAFRLSSAVLAQLALPLAVIDLADRVDHPVALLAAAATAQAIAVLAVVTGWSWSRAARDARSVLLAGGVAAGLVATALALGAAYGEDGSLVVGTALLLVVALALAAAPELARRWPSDGAPAVSAPAASPSAASGSAAPSPVAPDPVAPDPVALPPSLLAAPQGAAGAMAARAAGAAGAALQGGAAAVLVAAVWAPVVDVVPDAWTALWLSVAAVVLLGALLLVPSDRRSAPAVVLLVASVAPAVDALRALLPAVGGRLQWPDEAWTQTGDPAASRLLAVPGLDGSEWLTGTGARPSAVLLVVVAIALVGAGLVAVGLPALRGARAAAPPTLVAAGLLVPPALSTSYAGGLATDLALALLALATGVVLVRRRLAAEGAMSLASGAGALGLVLCWSFAVDAATLTVLPAAAAVLIVALAAGHGAAALRGARVGAGAAAAALLVGEAAAVARHGGAGWPAVLSLTFVLALVASGAAASVVTVVADRDDRFWTGVQRALVVTAAVAAILGTGAVAWWQGAGDAGVGLAMSVAAAVLLAASAAVPAGLPVAVVDVRIVAAAGATAGPVLAAVDGERLWLALLAVGVGVAVLGVREDHRWGWLAGLLLAASSWVRLALSDVTAPEAYTVPPALALLAVGLLRRRRDPAYASWRAYGPGLSLAFGPSLLRAVTDSGDLRPLLLALAALAVLGMGVARRLQAPLLVGGAVLAVDAMVQLAPYLVAAYEVVPRWVTIGLVGLLLLASGATYEQRVRDLRRVGREVARLG